MATFESESSALLQEIAKHHQLWKAYLTALSRHAQDFENAYPSVWDFSLAPAEQVEAFVADRTKCYEQIQLAHEEAILSLRDLTVRLLFLKWQEGQCQ